LRSSPSDDDERPYEIVWSSSALRSLSRLPAKVAFAGVEYAHSRLAENPHRAGKPLTLELEGVWSARLGDFRILYEIDDDRRRRVTILEATHRSDVYRRR
jgi:mRNA interferase RelE/StbE